MTSELDERDKTHLYCGCHLTHIIILVPATHILET